MPSFGMDLFVEFLALVLYAVLAIGFTAAGLLAEYASLQHVGGGDVVLAVWFAAMGAVLLYAGIYAVGYQELVMRARSLAA